MTALRSRFGALELQEYALAIVVVLLFVVGSILKPDSFPTWDNIRNMLTQASVVGVIAIGMTFVIATGGIDLSVGSVLAAAGLFGGVLVDPDGTTLVFILGAIGFATLLGTVNATSIAFGRVVPFIATLAMFSIGRGLALGSPASRSRCTCSSGSRSPAGCCSTGPGTAATSWPSAATGRPRGSRACPYAG
jgi:ribose transport system permease protein